MAVSKANFSGMFSWVLKRHHRALKSLLYSNGNLRDKIISYQIAAVDWRKVLLVLFMIFELGPYLESLWNGLTSEPIRCGVKEFFHPNN